MSQTALFEPAPGQGYGEGERYVSLLHDFRLDRTLPSSPSGDVISGSVSVIDSIASEWRALCSEGPGDQPFYRPEWISAYLRAFQPQARVVLIAPRRHGRLLGVLPLIEDQLGIFGMGATRLRAPVNEHSNRLDLIHGADDGILATELIWQTLVDLHDWDILDFREVPANGSFLRLLELAERDGYVTATRETLRSPYVPLEPFSRADDILAPLDSQFRRNLRNRKRRLANLGAVHVARVDHVDHGVLDRFFALEQSGWKGRSGTAIACSPETRRFYTDIAASADSNGYLALYELWCGEEVVAIGLGMDLGGRFFKLKSGINESFRSIGPGHLLNAEILGDLVGRGVSEFDMLGHNDEYKARWTGVYRQHYHCHVFRKGPAGRAAQTWTQRFIPAGRSVHHKLVRQKADSHAAKLGGIGVIGKETLRWC